MPPTSRLSAFLFLNIYMGEECEGVLIVWSWLHKHANKREGILPANSSRTDAVASNSQETHNHQREVLQRARMWDGAPRVTHSLRHFVFEEGTGKPCTVKFLPAAFLLTQTPLPGQDRALHSTCVSHGHETPGLCRNNCTPASPSELAARRD